MNVNFRDKNFVITTFFVIMDTLLHTTLECHLKVSKYTETSSAAV